MIANVSVKQMIKVHLTSVSFLLWFSVMMMMMMIRELFQAGNMTWIRHQRRRTELRAREHRTSETGERLKGEKVEQVGR